jgi:predicted AlkP superfamily pyrophosphatase or phosphodiesterase
MASYQKVVLVVLDGLRPEAVTPEVMPALTALSAAHWRALHAVTVSPSVTVAALTSLASGVSPERHGLIEPGFRTLGMFSELTLLPMHLRRNERQVGIVTTTLPIPSQILARTLLGVAGAVDLISGGEEPESVGETTAREVIKRGAGLTVVYLNDCDRAGHASMWMSPVYLEAASRLDHAVAILAELARRDDTLLIVTADHGGGGLVPHDHDGDHPLNLRIPLILAGRGVHRATTSQRPAHLLDIPPTIIDAFGLAVPTSYEGRVLSEAFTTERVAVA